MAPLSRRCAQSGAATMAAVSKAIVAAAFALAAITTTAAAQEWPARTITLIVPFAAGGGNDRF
jgi:tripartite-type tricarboxylate transporter receptor subunit TctC